MQTIHVSLFNAHMQAPYQFGFILLLQYGSKHDEITSTANTKELSSHRTIHHLDIK